MTNAMLMTPTEANLPGSAATLMPEQESGKSEEKNRQSRVLETMRSHYRADQQVKFLHLQAEAESLLQQLQAIKQQRQSAPEQSLGTNW